MITLRRVLEWMVFTLFWLLLVFKTDVQDVVMAAIAGLLTVVGINTGSRYLGAVFAPPHSWVGPLVSLPWKIVTDTGRVFRALFRQIFYWDLPVGQVVEVPFDYGRRCPEDSTRLALTLFGISITPNTVAITTSSDGIVVHQLEPTSEPVDRRDPKWPI